ncbi:armadillo-type protein [Mycena amicta]|nr:armadillo-type protein [Mycena amicta]
MSICKEKPDNLPPLDAIGIGPVDQASMTRTSSRGGTHRPNRTTSMSLPPGGNTIPGFPFPNKGGAAPFGGSIGNFNTGPKTSAERFAASGSAISAFTRPTSGMQHTTSQSGTGSALGNKRTRSKRGEIRDKNNSGSQGHFGFAPIQGMENAAPLQMTANRWDRRTLNQIDPDSPEVVNRKVKGLLNKLTMEKFDSISDQIIEWANKSEKEKDGRTLVQVIRLVFEAATNDERWTELYARFCRKMMEQISPKVQDDGMKTAEGKPIAGSQLIRKYLLNRCQEDFERGWVVKEATAAAIKSAEVPVLYFDEYYAAQKARRQSLGLIKFIGELFKLWMLTGRIMHECVKGLLGNVENPEDIESLCKLISNVGLLLDTQKARAHMDVYFSRMKELAKSKSVSSRMQFMLQDVIELRDRKWATRSNQMAAPSTIAAVHEAAAKEQAAKMAKDSYQRTISMSQGGSRHGADQGEFQGPEPDGWTSVAGSGNGPHPPPKASNFGKFGSSSKAGLPMDLRPSSVFSRSKESKREAVSRTSLVSNLSNSTNMLSTLSTGIVLQPRSKREVIVEMSVEAADRKIAQDLMEFFAIRNIDEAEAYFSALPPTHHARLVDKLVSTAIEAKEGGAQLVADLFSRAASKELCSVEAFEEGFLPSAEILDDVAIDAPKAPQNLMLMMRAVSFDTERAAHIAEKTGDADKLLGLLS